MTNWHSSVWFEGAILKNAFMMWLAQLEKLPTRARLTSWGMQIQMTWCLCSTYSETQDHLLLRCDYSVQIWNLVQLRLGLVPCIFHTWLALLAWTKTKNDSSPLTLRKIVAQATLYHIWKQRNNVLHNHQSVSAELIFKEIDRQIRNTITTRRNRKLFRDLMNL